MKRKLGAITVAIMMFTGHLFADTLELANGSLLEGDFVGSSNDIIMFNTGDGIEAFPESEVVGLYLSAGVATAKAGSAAQSNSITAAANTRLIIRTSESIDTRRHKVGHRFRGQLEGALVVDGVTVAPRGTLVYGQIVQSQQSGRLSGSSEMAISFTDIMIDDQVFEMRTSGLKAQGSNEAGRTAGRTARGAVLGGLYGGSSSARKGAKIGLGASLISSGASINIPAGTMVETHLAAPLTLPRP